MQDIREHSDVARHSRGSGHLSGGRGSLLGGSGVHAYSQHGESGKGEGS